MSAVFKTDKIDASLMEDGNFKPFTQRVDDRRADTVKAAGHFIGTAAEFTACVQYGKDRFDR